MPKKSRPLEDLLTNVRNLAWRVRSDGPDTFDTREWDDVRHTPGFDLPGAGEIRRQVNKETGRDTDGKRLSWQEILTGAVYSNDLTRLIGTWKRVGAGDARAEAIASDEVWIFALNELSRAAAPDPLTDVNWMSTRHTLLERWVGNYEDVLPTLNQAIRRYGSVPEALEAHALEARVPAVPLRPSRSAVAFPLAVAWFVVTHQKWPNRATLARFAKLGGFAVEEGYMSPSVRAKAAAILDGWEIIPPEPNDQNSVRHLDLVLEPAPGLLEGAAPRRHQSFWTVHEATLGMAKWLESRLPHEGFSRRDYRESALTDHDLCPPTTLEKYGDFEPVKETARRYLQGRREQTALAEAQGVEPEDPRSVVTRAATVLRSVDGLETGLHVTPQDFDVASNRLGEDTAAELQMRARQGWSELLAATWDRIRAEDAAAGPAPTTTPAGTPRRGTSDAGVEDVDLTGTVPITDVATRKAALTAMIDKLTTNKEGKLKQDCAMALYGAYHGAWPSAKYGYNDWADELEIFRMSFQKGTGYYIRRAKPILAAAGYRAGQLETLKQGEHLTDLELPAAVPRLPPPPAPESEEPD